jgi:hypothetical protein
VHRLASGRWLVWAPSEDPFRPAVCLVAALDESALNRTRYQLCGDDAYSQVFGKI